jgi:hypothetical protein
MSNVIKIISNHVSHVVSIDFSNNKLPTLDFFSNLEAPQIKFLSLDDNRLDVNQLQKLKQLKLVRCKPFFVLQFSVSTSKTFFSAFSQHIKQHQHPLF